MPERQNEKLKSRTFKTTYFLLRMLEKIFGNRIITSGFEEVSEKKNPILFVANHFTRAETFILPYVFYQQSERLIRSLAAEKLFRGSFGNYLQALGTMSVKNNLRNRTIISDLLTGKNNWLIYPEGVMVKNKKIYKNRQFVLETPSYLGKPHSGAALFALKAELLRCDLLRYGETLPQLAALKKKYFFSNPKEINPLPTLVVPINITYYPIRPATNYIEQMAKRFVKKLPREISEELHLEGNLLLHSDMHIHCEPPIDLKQYLENKKIVSLLNHLSSPKPFHSALRIRRYFVSARYRHSLTRYFMQKIYRSLQINFDHLFLACLKQAPHKKLDYDHLIYSLVVVILFLRGEAEENRYRLHSSLTRASTIGNLFEHRSPYFQAILKQALAEKLVRLINEKNGAKTLIVYKKKLREKISFDAIRLVNVCQVISNEFAPFTNLQNFIKSTMAMKSELLRKKIAHRLKEEDVKDYQSAYKRNANIDKKIAFSIGKPFFLSGSREMGVVLSHGYKSSPKEIYELATYLHKEKGLSVYGVRLAGHGTCAEDLASSTWKDWYHSYDVGYTLLQAFCRKIIVAGFSTGGLLAMLTASNPSKRVKAFITINSPLLLMDKKNHLVPAVVWWKQFWNSIKSSNEKRTYIQTMTEYPETNYTKHALASVLQLKKLMQICQSRLSKITHPSLILQASRDNVVDPKSADIIHKKISTPPQNKRLVTFNLKTHVMIKGECKQMVFREIGKFIDELE